MYLPKEKWISIAKCLLKSELAKRNINYVELSHRLEQIGIYESPENLSNKISRGTFSTIFLLQCMTAIDCENILLNKDIWKNS